MTEIGGEGDSLDLTPSPRLLEVIGDLDLLPWQCVAELIDNSFDDFSKQTGDRDDDPDIAVTLPTDSANPDAAFVSVVDNGRGLDLQTLQMSLRAGYSGNERFGSLGLFGMGFNVATARLGNLTEVRTTRRGDAEWLVVTIDLRALQREETYRVPVTREPKDDPEVHGTEIVVRQLRREMFEAVRRSNAKQTMRDLLGDVYSYLLREPDVLPFAGGTSVGGSKIRLRVNGTLVQPRLPCVWGEDRSVTVRGGDTPAVIQIDHELPAAQACLRCGRWAHLPIDVCLDCGSDQLEWRQRRIHGWLGIQRYLHRTDFGIDFLRQGRKILRRDKSVFSWVNPDSDVAEPEYPVELPSGQGRIVGEVHLDHVAVSYRKHDFVRDGRDWKTAVAHIRGEGPLKPQQARTLGYGDNNSPLGRLYSAFRRNDAGLRCLIPGDNAGNGPIHDKAREWGEKYRRGDTEFQTDAVWYAAAVAYDRAKGHLSDSDDLPTDEATRQTFIDAGLGDPGEAGPDTPPDEPDPGVDSNAQSDEPNPEPETDDARYGRYRQQGRRFLDMEGDVTLPMMGRLSVEVYGVAGQPLRRTPEGNPLPTVSWMPSGGKVEVFVDESHRVFTEFGRDPRDYALFELATMIRARARSDDALTALSAEITTQFGDQRLTAPSLRERVDDLLGEIHRRLSNLSAVTLAACWQALPPTEKEAAERAAQVNEPRLDWAAAVSDGSFVNFISAAGAAALVRTHPADLLDGGVFTTTYASWTDPLVRDRAAARVSADLEALDRFMVGETSQERDELMRVHLTERLTRSSLAAD